MGKASVSRTSGAIGVVAFAGLVMASMPQAQAAQAAPIAPVPTLLSGKTCQGTFNTGRRRVASEGALQLRFTLVGGQLTAQVSRLVTKHGYNQADYALMRRRMIDASGYEPLGDVRDLAVTGDKISYTDPLGARVELTYRDGDLAGVSDPRGGSDPRMTRIAFVRLHCG